MTLYVLIWILSPRDSLGPAIALVLLGLAVWLLHGRRRRQIWPALVFAGLGLGAAAWRLSVVMIPRSLDVEFADTIYLSSLEDGIPEPRSAPMQTDLIKRIFSRVFVRPRMIKVPSRWWIRFEGGGRSVTYRVTEEGMIAEDVPASAIQDIYAPAESGLRDLIRLNVIHIHDRANRFKGRP
jgi:hypothetical protein